MSRSSAKKARRARLSRWVNGAGLLLVIALAALALYSHFDPEARARRLATSRATAVKRAPAGTTGTSSATTPTRVGQPWEYDAAANAHWDPRPGHQHWHAGPPPPDEQRLADPSMG